MRRRGVAWAGSGVAAQHKASACKPAHATPVPGRGCIMGPSNHRGCRMPDLSAVFAELRAVMAPYADTLDAKKDDAAELYVDTRHLQKNKKPLFFGAVQVKKSFVSFHLMPVYLQPELLFAVSPELKARMQGKSCFNFSEVDRPLFKELAALTQAGYASYKAQGFV